MASSRRRTPRKRPCSICGRWFEQDPRVGRRQKACKDPACQKERRRRGQAGWRERNPDYMRAWRMRTKADDAQASRLPPSTPPPLNRLPWDIAKDEFGTQGAEFIGCLGRVLLEVAKDEIGSYPPDNKRQSRKVLVESAKAERPAMPP
jgi:hypothetical protein